MTDESNRSIQSFEDLKAGFEKKFDALAKRLDDVIAANNTQQVALRAMALYIFKTRQQRLDLSNCIARATKDASIASNAEKMLESE